jgi:hypothetical protein
MLFKQRSQQNVHEKVKYIPKLQGQLTLESPQVNHSLTIRKGCLRVSLWESTIHCWPKFQCQNSFHTLIVTKGTLSSG